MNKQQNFKNNLILFQKMKGLSLAEYSAELDIPKSTLQSILQDGNTSLHTAIHISERIGISLDSLLGDSLPAEKQGAFLDFIRSMSWFASLSDKNQRIAITLMEELSK